MKTSDFSYELPSEFIAQTPVEPRDSSRLLVLDRNTGEIKHSIFREIGRFLRPGDLLVLNETRVLPARLYGRKMDTGGKVELLLLRQQDPLTWEALVGGKGMHRGRKIRLAGDSTLRAEIAAELDGSRRLVRFSNPVDRYLEEHGNAPLPPYIHTPLQESERYQTVYAREPGSAAAPTAGLHFTRRLIEELKAQGIAFAPVVLHVGLDTFAPVKEERPEEHEIHTEWCLLPPETAAAVNRVKAEGGRVVAVGTTSVRVIESAGQAASRGQAVAPFEGPTDLFILPGFTFKVVNAMVTNFHLPESTLIMLVSAFARKEQILHAYEVAKQQGYRFYSFGDAMLIL